MALQHSRRLRAALALVVVVPVGFAGKFYRGPAAHWVNDSLGGAFYEIAWCLFAAWAVPRWRPAPIAIAVLAATCVLEFLQLWHPAPLEAARSRLLGALILGTTFDWSDFLYYFGGAAAGYGLLKLIER